MMYYKWRHLFGVALVEMFPGICSDLVDDLSEQARLMMFHEISACHHDFTVASSMGNQLIDMHIERLGSLSPEELEKLRGIVWGAFYFS